ncbi:MULTISPECIES: hypothetical protein [Serratia]|jgi:hypothetical protein|uniref:hypothetical protein n=1 Tax=Serratia TaxID=613 RepID=UPI0002A42607|nr:MULTISPECIES: hypothetical protein [Serratia]MEE4411376.1 hypothetical protein [Serratia sp. C2(2)]MEE4447251.1 hypothetical protein [Serratia sp. C2(1)]EKF65289.1 hypothetical protein B194_1801 [Serratia plymuthica A30]MEB6539679.1 hypothetical protein [Serratia plymuthica]UNK26544.1 hypothetical protein MNO11_17095 [Serratia plymuthica]
MPDDATGNAGTVAHAGNDDASPDAIAQLSARRRKVFPFLSNIHCPLYAHKKYIKNRLLISVYEQKGHFALGRR